MKLMSHPDSPADAVRGVEADWKSKGGSRVELTYRVDGGLPLLPGAAIPGRADNLWQATCFELFLRPDGGGAYIEFNFSPSGQWAAYAFESYRQGMRDLALASDPVIAIGTGGDFTLAVDLDLSGIWSGPMTAALTSILSERDGTKSYWSLAHPAGKPDFHDPACFAIELPAPPAP